MKYRESPIWKAMQVFNPQVSAAKAEESITALRQQAVVAANPNRTRYQIGQILKNANGLEAEVVGFNDTGDPILKWKR